MVKDTLRKEMCKQRDALSKLAIETLSQKITDNLILRPSFLQAKTIAIYLPKGTEVDTYRIIGAAIRMKKEVLVPVTDHKITFYKFQSYEDLLKGKFGILEPKTKIAPQYEPDLVIVPGLSFGLCMHRLGYGKGYYDKYLATSRAHRIGICYDFQIVEKLPSHENDQRMDEIITEKRVI